MINSSYEDMTGSFRPRCRFDRMFYRSPSDILNKTILKPTHFELVGKEKLHVLSKPVFCSDHWGIKCNFDIVIGQKL